MSGNADRRGDREMSVGRLGHTQRHRLFQPVGAVPSPNGENGHPSDAAARRLLDAVDPGTRELLARRHGVNKGRGWLLRRLLLAADVVALTLAFLLAVAISQG